MRNEELTKVLDGHRAWMREEKGARAVLRGEDLRGADLRGADLRGVVLSKAVLRGVVLSSADLRDANLSSADLRNADLSSADLRNADLRNAGLGGAVLSRGADLRGADLGGADLSGADLRGADLRDANLSSADLRGADLRDANLSSAIGIPSAAAWLSAFARDAEGLIVYKAMGRADYPAPIAWRIEAGAVLAEIVNPTRTQLCGCGVNFGTLAYVRAKYSGSIVWRCRIAWLDLADVVVPYATDGKARCARLTLLGPVGAEENA